MANRNLAAPPLGRGWRVGVIFWRPRISPADPRPEGSRQTPSKTVAGDNRSETASPLPPAVSRWDIVLLGAALILANLHLVGITNLTDWIFLPAPVAAGEWWRLISHPFVHLSWYHLLLDGAAFFLLYPELKGKCWLYRLAALMACGGGSLLAAWLGSPQIALRGLCGLSGTAHGLMALSGLAQMRQPSTRRMGALLFGLVAAKSIYEGFSGTVLFTFMHMGLCGTPLAMAHTGGAAGGIAAYWLGRWAADADGGRP